MGVGGGGTNAGALACGGDATCAEVETLGFTGVAAPGEPGDGGGFTAGIFGSEALRGGGGGGPPTGAASAARLPPRPGGMLTRFGPPPADGDGGGIDTRFGAAPTPGTGAGGGIEPRFAIVFAAGDGGGMLARFALDEGVGGGGGIDRRLGLIGGGPSCAPCGPVDSASTRASSRSTTSICRCEADESGERPVLSSFPPLIPESVLRPRVGAKEPNP